MSDRTDRGRRPLVSDGEILAVFEAADEPVLTTANVADQLAIGHRATLNRLDALRDDGLLESKAVGSGRVWWLAVDAAGASAAHGGDPLFDLPTFSGEAPTDVSERVDEHIASAVVDEARSTDR